MAKSDGARRMERPPRERKRERKASEERKPGPKNKPLRRIEREGEQTSEWKQELAHK